MKLLRAAWIGLALLGCGELPPPQTASGGALGGEADTPVEEQHQPHQPPSQEGSQATDVPAAPSLEPVPGRYGYESVPVRGRAAPYLTIFVEGGRAPVATDTDGSGSFCVDVPLKLEQEQTLEVFAQNEQGKTSEPATLHIEHDPSLAETVVIEPPIVDLAEGAIVHADTTPKEGKLSSLTDGNVTTTALFAATTLWIDLGATHRIDRIEIVFPDSPGVGDTFATEYLVLASRLNSPSIPPAEDEYGWDLLFDVYPGAELDAGDGDTDTFLMSPELEARYVAFYLIEDNNWDWFTSDDIRVAEIRIFGRALEAPAPVPVAPSCADGVAH